MFRQSNCSNPTFSKNPDFPVWVVPIITRQGKTYKPLLLSANFKIGTIVSLSAMSINRHCGFFSKSKHPFRLSTDRLSAKMRELKHNILRQFGIRVCLEKFQLPSLFNAHGQCLWLILEETVCSQCRTEIHEEVMYGAMA